MRNTLYMVGLVVACGGCVMKPTAPPVVYNPVDVIASGKPPLVFSVNRAGAVSVIDVTTQSRVYYHEQAGMGDLMPSKPLQFRLDAERKALTVPGKAATQPSDVDDLLPIDPSHVFAVTFAPDFKTTPPATMPSK